MHRLPRQMLLLGMIVLLGGGTSFACPPAPAGELERLVQEVQPPARFTQHRPDFSVRQTPHRYWWWGEGGLEERTITLQVIYDGELPVGFLHGHFFARHPGHDTSGVINDTFNPIHQRTGTELPDGSPVDRYRDEVHPGREILVTATGQTLEYEVVRGDWPRDPQATFGARSRITLRVDPVLGYVFDRRTEWRIDRPYTDNTGRADSFGSGGWYSGGITSTWRDERSYDYTGYTHPLGEQQDPDAPRYRMWANNSESMFRRHHPPIRPNGFIAYLRDRDGWGLLSTHECHLPAHYNKCPIWGGIHMHRPLIEQQHDGYRSGSITARMVTLPPEIVERIIEQAQVVSGHGHMILVRVDGEDFEDQPLPASTPQRGFQPEHNTPAGHRISTRHARSGSRSLEVDGIGPERFIDHRFFPRDRAHTRFLPGRSYRLECWVKVDGEDTEAFVIPTPQLGHTPRQLVDGEGIGTHRTASVRSGEGWRRVTVEFTGARHGTPMNVHFVVIGEGKGYFDDFKIERIDGETP